MFQYVSQDGVVKRTLYDQDGKANGTVQLEARYIPVPLKLEPRESINSKADICFSMFVAEIRSDQGVLQVQLLGGGELRGADRSGMFFPYPKSSMLSHTIDSGTSDPYVTFTLDGQKVYTSETKKKELHPQWNETFVVTVVSVTRISDVTAC